MPFKWNQGATNRLVITDADGLYRYMRQQVRDADEAELAAFRDECHRAIPSAEATASQIAQAALRKAALR